MWLGNVPPSWRVLHPPETPSARKHPPRLLLWAESPHLLSFPIENMSAVPIRYWSPVIFVVVALLVLFFTYRRKKGEGEHPVSPSFAQPHTGSAGKGGQPSCSPHPRSSEKCSKKSVILVQLDAGVGRVCLYAGGGEGMGRIRLSHQQETVPRNLLWPQLSPIGTVPRCTDLALQVQKSGLFCSILHLFLPALPFPPGVGGASPSLL